jgi:ribonuclease BN (tRNA processing enzyme)
VQLLLLGTAGYFPTETRHTPCLMLPELGTVFDAGTAMFRVRQYLTSPNLDVFLTHVHLDHVVGLSYLFGVLPPGGSRSVRVHGEPAHLAAVREHLFHRTLFPVLPPMEYVPLSGPVGLPRGVTLRYFPLDHPGGTLGYRLDWTGGSFAYVTDTTARTDAAYVDEIRGVELLVHECYFPDGQEEAAALTGHSCLTPVLDVAVKARVGRLILVHINPLADNKRPLDLDYARRIFPATEIGVDGLVVHL